MSKMKAILKIHNRIHVLRAEKRLTQEELAHHVGVTRVTINSIESGNYNPSLDLVFRIAIFFGVKIEDIFEVDSSEFNLNTKELK